jgi:hypothetical protein
MKRSSVACRRLAMLATAAVALSTSATAAAGNEIGLGLSWDPRVPLGGLKDLAPNASPSGVQAKWEYYALDNRIALGLGFQYHYFQAADRTTTVEIPNGAATAPFTRYAYFITLFPTLRYYPLGARPTTVRPFLEIGAGATSSTSAVLASDLSRRSNEGGFIAQPSAGVLWTIRSRDTASAAASAGEGQSWTSSRSRESMLAVSASLAWAFTTADIVTASDVSYVGLQLGLYSKL